MDYEERQDLVSYLQFTYNLALKQKVDVILYMQVNKYIHTYIQYPHPGLQPIKLHIAVSEA